MSLHTSFFKFETSTDFGSNSEGYTSLAGLAHVSVSTNLGLEMSSDLAYHITQLHIGGTVAADTPSAAIVTSTGGGRGTDCSYTRHSAFYHTVAPAALTGLSEKVVDFNPPIKIAFSSTKSHISLAIFLADSEDVPSFGYNGFTTKVKTGSW